jgi:hypothetical protein
VAPSCWNQGLWRSLKFWICSATKVSSISTYHSDFTVVAFPLSSSKKQGPITPRVDTAHQTVTFGLCNGRSRNLRGFSGAQYLQLCLFTYTRWYGNEPHPIWKSC